MTGIEIAMSLVLGTVLGLLACAVLLAVIILVTTDIHQ